MPNSKQYESAFSSRYTSKEMGYLFSPHFRAATFRKLWLQLAVFQKKLGLPIQNVQIAEMQKHIENIDFDCVHQYEKEFRHDVMAHIHAFGEVCPKARPIIHLGATSCYVTDNADLIIMKEALKLLQKNLYGVMQKLAKFAEKHAKLACLGYTHFQPAQPTTVGKRACLWLQDFALDFGQITRKIANLPFLGAKGATGTQSSFLTLFKGDHEKVKKLDLLLAHHFDFNHAMIISGQTYTRKWDFLAMQGLASLATSAHKFATDIRLLANTGEITEKSGKKQVGSSAMPHKKNPIYAERICALARYLLSLLENPAYTASLQWLERSLDDSANRRLAIPEAFLTADAILQLLAHQIDKLDVNAALISRNLEEEMPNLIMENLLMLAVLQGKDRQEVHEKLRLLANKKDTKNIASHIKKFCAEIGLPHSAKLAKDLLSKDALTGRSYEQVKDFMQFQMKPLFQEFKKLKPSFSSVEV